MKDSIEYHEAGSKKSPSVVFLHGLFFDSSMWSSHIESLSLDYHCIALELTVRNGDGSLRPFTIETVAKRLEEAVKQSKAKKPVLCGHGLGGYVALRALERNPTAYSGLMLCDAHPGAPSNPELIYWSNLLDQLFEEGVGAVVKTVFPDLFAQSSREEEGSPFEKLQHRAEQMETERLAGQIVATMSRTDTSESLEEIGMPKLLLTGQNDQFAVPEDIINLGLRITGAQFVRVPDTGHAAPVEHPTLVLKAFNRFLTEIYDTQRV